MDAQTKAENFASAEDGRLPSWRELFLYFLMLGFINIGGPVAQISMMFNHMVERRHWLTKERFVKIMAFCHMLPGPEALQLAIYVGYLKRGVFAGILAGLTFIIPGAVVMITLSWLYVTYGSLPQVNDALYVLKPAVLGIIAAGIIKLGRAAIRNFVPAALQFWWSVCVAGLLTARRGGPIPLADLRSATGWRGAERSDTRAVHALFYLRRLHQSGQWSAASRTRPFECCFSFRGTLLQPNQDSVDD